MYPVLKIEWRTVISRYNYHFGGIDGEDNSLGATSLDESGPGVSDSIRDSFDGNNQENIDFQDTSSLSNSSANECDPMSSVGIEDHDLSDINARANVKGFRNWTGKTKQELMETKNKIVR